MPDYGDDLRLAVSVTDAGGHIKRWGFDAPDPEDVPGDLSFSTGLPGGFRDCSTSLFRDIRKDYTDLNLFDQVRVYGPGNHTAWEGRVQSLPRSHSGYGTAAPSAVGFAAHLKDDPSFVEVYIDRDLSRWQSPPLDRRSLLAAAGIPMGGVSVTTDGAISWMPTASQPLAIDHTEVWYTAPAGCHVARVDYMGGEQGAGWTNFETPTLYVTTDPGGNDYFSAALTFNNQIHTAALGGVPGGTNVWRRYAMLRTFALTGFTPDSGGMHRYVAYIGVVGFHNAPLVMSDDAVFPPSTGGGGVPIPGGGGGPNVPFGVRASDVVKDIVTRVAPQLTWHPDNPATPHVITHLVFDEPMHAEDAIVNANRFDLWEWGVYENRRFYYRPADPDRLCWEARIADGAQVQLEGETTDAVYNGVVVRFTDPAGRARSVGPPGSPTDEQNAALQDTSPTNPANAAGITRKWGVLGLSHPTVPRDAVQLGAVWLAERMIPQRRGTITLNGYVKHPTEGRIPVWRVRAGDWIRLTDHPANVPRRILSTRYSHGNRQITVDTGLDVAKLDAFFERIGVALIGAT